jgi:DNA-binding MarR family transcriptional regulator
MGTHNSLLHNCLYFTANKLARVITRMAEEEFKITGLSPPHAFLMMTVHDHPGIGQKELCEQLHLAPSTVTRFIDSLEHKGFLIRKSEGKVSKIYSTVKGKLLQEPIDAAWKGLYHRYSKILGSQDGESLTHLIDEAGQKLENDREKMLFV